MNVGRTVKHAWSPHSPLTNMSCFFQGKEALSTPCPLVSYFLTVGPGRLGRCVHHQPPTACRTEGQARKQLQEKVFSSHFHSPFLGLQTTGKQMGGK